MKTICSDTGISGLHAQDLPEPVAGPGRVVVRMRASAVNPADEKVLSGSLVGSILHGKQSPVVVGYDVAGTVESVGAGVTELSVGDEVFGHLPYGRGTLRGTYAERVEVAACDLARSPAKLTPSTAAAIGTAGMTALQAMRDTGGLKAGQRVLIIGASGGVGSLAVGIAVRLGAEVTAVCSASAMDFVRALGATHVRDRASALGGDTRFHVVFDAASAHSWFSTRHLLEPGGTYVATLPGAAAMAGIAVAPLFGQRARFFTLAARRSDLDLLASWALDGMPVPIDSTFPVRDLAAALARMGRGGMKGRVVIEVDGGF